MSLKTTMAALIAFTLVLALCAHDGTEYQCHTDTDEDRKCLILCN